MQAANCLQSLFFKSRLNSRVWVLRDSQSMEPTIWQEGPDEVDNCAHTIASFNYMLGDDKALVPAALVSVLTAIHASNAARQSVTTFKTLTT